MKVIYLVLVSVFSTTLYASITTIVDNTSTNRFLGQDCTSCSSMGQNPYVCGLKFNATSLSGSYLDGSALLLGVDFLSPAFPDAMYIFNQFGYWESAQAPVIKKMKDAGQTQAQIAQVVPQQGVFMIQLLKNQPALDFITQNNIAVSGRSAGQTGGQSCFSGSQLVVALLKVNDGTGLYTWSCSAKCLPLNAQITITISSDTDSSVPDAMRANSNYAQAVGSPRSIVLS